MPLYVTERRTASCFWGIVVSAGAVPPGRVFYYGEPSKEHHSATEKVYTKLKLEIEFENSYKYCRVIYWYRALFYLLHLQYRLRLTLIKTNTYEKVSF